MVYSTTEVNLDTFIPSLRGKPGFLGGRDVIVDGDLKNKNLFAYEDLTVKGKVSDSNLSATIGKLTVGDVENSVLTAHTIIITGTAKNTKQVILPPLRYIPARPVRRTR